MDKSFILSEEEEEEYLSLAFLSLSRITIYNNNNKPSSDKSFFSPPACCVVWTYNLSRRNEIKSQQYKEKQQAAVECLKVSQGTHFYFYFSTIKIKEQ